MKDREKNETRSVDYWQNRAAARFENQEQQSFVKLRNYMLIITATIKLSTNSHYKALNQAEI